MSLNAKMVAAAKPSAERQEIKDGSYPLFLTVYPSGEKAWTWRGKAGGKFRRHTFGRIDDLTLAEARDAAVAFRQALRRGELPAPIKAREPEPLASPAPKGVTVAKAFDLYMSDEGDKQDSAAAKRRFFEADIIPAIGSRLITTLTHDDCDAIIQRKYDAIRAKGGNGVGANRLRSTFARFLKWCRQEGRAKTGLTFNPMSDVIKRVKHEPVKQRFLSEREIKWFFAGLTAMRSAKWNDKSAEYARAYEVILRLMARRNEVLSARWDWIAGDVMMIPPSKTKTDSAYRIWLHPSVMALIGSKPKGAAADAPVFDVHALSTDKPTSRLRSAMEKLAAKDGHAIEHWTLHDLRRTGATQILDERFAGAVTPFVVDRLLNHKDPTTRGKHYSVNVYAAEKRAALQAWNDWLDELKKAADE